MQKNNAHSRCFLTSFPNAAHPVCPADTWSAAFASTSGLSEKVALVNNPPPKTFLQRDSAFEDQVVSEVPSNILLFAKF